MRVGEVVEMIGTSPYGRYGVVTRINENEIKVTTNRDWEMLYNRKDIAVCPTFVSLGLPKVERRYTTSSGARLVRLRCGDIVREVCTKQPGDISEETRMLEIRKLFIKELGQ